jgi:hypothetical protein
VSSDRNSLRSSAPFLSELREALLEGAQRTAVGERRTVELGQLAGFPVLATLSHDSAGTSVTLALGEVPRHVPALSAAQPRELTPVGLVTRLENLAGDPGPMLSTKTNAQHRPALIDATYPAGTATVARPAGLPEHCPVTAYDHGRQGQ